MAIKYHQPPSSRQIRRSPTRDVVPYSPNGRTHGSGPAIEADIDALCRDLRDGIDAIVHQDETRRAIYSTDGSNYRQVPLAVVIPRTKEAAAEAVRIAHRHGAPLLTRGAGTSLAGQGCNAAVVLDFSNELHYVLDIDPAARLARVEPGCVLDRLQDQAKPHDLFFCADPSTHSHCSIGGMIGNNSCGIHSVMGGRTSDNVQSMEVLTYDGVRLTVGPTSDKDLERLCREEGRVGEIYRGIREIRDEYGDDIRRLFPKIPRRVSGYNLDDLLPENGCNVARALAGSEGTLVTFLEAEVNLIHRPPNRSLLVLGYGTVFDCGDHAAEMVGRGAMGVEGLDSLLMEYMKVKHLHPEHRPILPAAGGWLLVEFGGDTQEEADRRAQEACEDVLAHSKGTKPTFTKIYSDPGEQEAIWTLRESGLAATAWVSFNPDTWPGWEDTAVEPERLGDYLREFQALMDRHRYDAALYGHFGQGLVHCRLPFDLYTKHGIDTFLSFSEGVVALVKKYGGVMSGEHGDGQARGGYLEELYGPRLMEAFRKFKTLWDPQGKMNPGKAVDAMPPNENLRLGTEFQPWEPDTYFDYAEDQGSFSRAATRCVGVGKCRREDNAFMCPSYQVSRNEKDSTRGRARALFEMIHGGIIKDRWKSKAVKETLDLCLSCKGCLTDCPVNVDMATYKSEFLAHHYGLIRPRAHYAMGFIGTWSRLASIAPGVANFFGQTKPFSTLLQKIGGITTERSVPRFAKETFRQRFRREHGGRFAGPEDGKRVLIFPDIYNDHFFPGTLWAAKNVLVRLGYRVELPKRRLPAVRPLIHFGMLNRAQRQLHAVIRDLKEEIRLGIPIVGLEPSTVSVYRDELVKLFPHDLDAKRLAKCSFLFTELLANDDVELPRPGGKALLHGHCHQKASLGMDSLHRLLDQLGIEATEPEPSCCGLAGAFGFEAEKHDFSMQVGERHLLPSVRESPEDALLLADGFSCRKQILDGTGRRPLHIAELLDEVMSAA
ncbi:MAG: FAD-linked oxidase C-terminal domain-containing protein [Sumerlaeia bacterium]